MKILCNNKESVLEKYPHLKIKEDRIVVKRYNDNNEFQGSIILPTVKYPIPSDTIHIFSLENLEQINDKRIIDAVDTVPSMIGYCYTNSDNVAKALRDIGENPKIFCGWNFVNTDILPVHHCWVMLGENQIIDLSAIHTIFMKTAISQYPAKELKTWDKNKWRDYMYQYIKNTEKYKNSERTILGTADGTLYIGAEVKSGAEGKLIFNQLKEQFPDHETDLQFGNMKVNPLQARLYSDVT